MPETTARRWLAVILVVYVALGALYAVQTPLWQAPDEPAHYNYARHVAETGRLPVLQAGDYPADYLETLKAQGFPADMPIDAIRYEGHQPPLYYVLAAGVYRLAGAVGASTPYSLRLFSVLLGTTGLVVGYGAIRRLFPGEPLVALGAVAFAGTLPMHVAMTATVNNDVLSELLIALVALSVARPGQPWTVRRALVLGVLLGLAALTKMQAYVAYGIAALAFLRDLGAPSLERRHSAGPSLRHALLALGVAAALALPWLARNALVYGPTDPLALGRHDAVVQGQPTTAGYLAEHGWGGLARAFVLTTFHSFWGQFGWMGVLLDARIYHTLMLTSVVAAVGLGLYLFRLFRRGRGTASQATADEGTASDTPSTRPARGALTVMLVWIGLAILGYLWWNTRFLQHQGRYLFPAILPLGAAFSLGIMELARGPLRTIAALLGALAVGLLAWGAATRDVPGTSLAIVAALGVMLVAVRWAEVRRPGAALATCYLTMAGLAVWSLVGCIVPALT